MVLKVSGNTDGDSYRLRKDRSISEQINSSIFTAHLNGKRVVVKFVKPGYFGRKQAQEAKSQYKLFIAKVIALRRIGKQKSIVQLRACDAHIFVLYLNLIPGASLASPEWRSHEYKFLGDEKTAQRILSDMSGAIAYIHSRGVLHMDIKPANIVYDVRRGAVLIDFGHSDAVHPKISSHILEARHGTCHQSSYSKRNAAGWLIYGHLA